MAEPSVPSPIEPPPPSYEIARLNLDQKVAIATERSLSISEQRHEREQSDRTEDRDEAAEEETRPTDASRNPGRRAASLQIDGQQRPTVRPLNFRKKSRGGSKDDFSLSLSTKDKERPSWFEEAKLGTSTSNSSASGRPLPAPRGAREREQNNRSNLHILPEDSDEDRSIPPPPFADVDNSLDGPAYERYALSDARRRRNGGVVVLRYSGEDYTTSPPSPSHSLGGQLRHNAGPSPAGNTWPHHAPQQSRLDVPTVLPRPRSADPHTLPPPPPRLSFDPYVAYEGTKSSVYGQTFEDSRDAGCDATALYSSAVAPHLSSHQKSRPTAPKVKRYTPSISSLPEYDQHQQHHTVPTTKPVYAVQDYATSRASIYSQSSVSSIPQYPQIAQYPQMAQYPTQQNYTRPMSAARPVDSQRWSTASSHYQSQYYPR